MQAVAEDVARLLLDDPDRYPIERLMSHAEWLIGRIALAGR